MTNKVLDVEWRSARGTVGFVLTVNSAGQKSVRVGCTHTEFSILQLSHGTEKEDAQKIADDGAKLSFEEAKAFFPYLKQEEYKKW